MHADIDLNALVSAIGDAVVVCDAKGRVIVWNPAAERMFGYAEAEALGRSLDLIIPDRLRQRHWDGYERSMTSGTTKYGRELLRVPAVDKSGRSMSIAFTVAMLKGADGRVNAIASVIRDETVRFAEERALKKRVTDLEAQVASGSAAA